MNGIMTPRGLPLMAALVACAALFVPIGPGIAAHAGGAAAGAAVSQRLLQGYARSDCACGGIDVFHQPRDANLACEIARIACRHAARIAAEIGLQRIDQIAIVIAPGGDAFAQLHAGRLPEWGEAFADPARMLIGIDAARVVASPRPLRTVVLHELSHLFFEQRTGGAHSPAWLLEGIAMRQSGEWRLEDEWNLALSVWRGDLPRLGDLWGAFPRPADQAAMAYRISHAAVERLIGDRTETIVTLTAFLRDSGDFERAFLLTFGESTEDFEARFHATLERRYRRVSVLLHVSPYWLAVAAMFLVVYAIKRYRTRRKLAAWDLEDGE